MSGSSRARLLITVATMGLGAAIGVTLSGQAQTPYVGMLDEHPSIQYATRATTDVVAKLNAALAQGVRSLHRGDQAGFLSSVLQALDVPVESQLLVFSKTGIQRDLTSPQNPRALYFNEKVVVGYVHDAPLLELAAQDPQQGTVFYTLDQSAAAPSFARRTACLSCHVSANTMEVPGLIDRSNMVDVRGNVMPELGNYVVNHQTPHTQRWGGWFVTTSGPTPPYQLFGHLGNLTATGPQIVSDHVLVEWLNSDPESRGYLSPKSDLAAMLVFNHQTHAMNLLTRLNWEARVSEKSAGVRTLVSELADYFLFVGEASNPVPVTPRPGFAEALERRAPKDRKGRSFAQLELKERLLRYPCSYMIYSDAFDGLPASVKDAVYRRVFQASKGEPAIAEILRDTKRDLPEDLRQ